MAHEVQDERRREWNAHIRGGWVILFLWQGSKLSTRDIARLVGVTPQMAGRMMAILSAEFPLVCQDHLWQWMEKS